MYREKLKDMDRAINSLRALYNINLRVLNLVNAPNQEGPETGEGKWQGKGGQSSSPSRMLKEYAQDTN
jgi:hypothetical protein